MSAPALGLLVASSSLGLVVTHLDEDDLSADLGRAGRAEASVEPATVTLGDHEVPPEPARQRDRGRAGRWILGDAERGDEVA